MLARHASPPSAADGNDEGDWLANGAARSAVMMLVMIALSVGLELFQEEKASVAAEKLKAMIVANNLPYDLGQTAIPTDNVDAEDVQQPRAWDIRQLTRFMLLVGP